MRLALSDRAFARIAVYSHRLHGSGYLLMHKCQTMRPTADGRPNSFAWRGSVVSIGDLDGLSIWSYGPGPKGSTVRDPRIIAGVIATLKGALCQAEGELSCCPDYTEVVSNIRGSAAEIQHDIPLAVLRNGDAGREICKIAAVVAESATGLVKAVISVVEKQDIAPVRAVYDGVTVTAY
jgi:hypothetical protein